MSMKPYDIKRYGQLLTYDDYTANVSNKISSWVKLYNVASVKGSAPYTAYNPQNFVKTSVNKTAGWGSWRRGTTLAELVRASRGIPEDVNASQLAFDPLSSTRATAETVAYNLALEKLNSKVRGNVDLSIDLAQGSKTLRLGQDMAKVVRSVASLRNPAALLKAAGNARLTWVYGIKPTLQSIFDSALHTAKHYNNEFAFSQARGGDGFSGSAKNTGFQWPDNTYTNAWSGHGSARQEFGIVLRIPDTPLTNAARLTSLNPVSIGWELIPFSFVIDWFVDIGGYLRALETAVTYNSYFVRGYRTVTTITEYWVSGSRHLVAPAYPNEAYLGEWEMKIIRKNKWRGVLSSYPMPARPVLSANLGSGRLLNGAALLTTLLGRKSRGVTAAGGGSSFERGVKGFA